MSAKDAKSAVSRILGQAKAQKRTSLTAPEGKLICDAYGIAVPKEGLAKTAAEAAKLGAKIGFPVVLKIVSPQILHKTEAGGVLVGVKTPQEAQKGFATIVANAKKYDRKHIMRLILNSRAYQLSSTTMPTNEKDQRFYSHYYARRLPAEGVHDAIYSVTGVADQFEGYPHGLRAVQIPDTNVKSRFLAVFARATASTWRPLGYTACALRSPNFAYRGAPTVTRSPSSLSRTMPPSGSADSM